MATTTDKTKRYAVRWWIAQWVVARGNEIVNLDGVISYGCHRERAQAVADRLNMEAANA